MAATSNILLSRVREGKPLSISERTRLALQLSVPAILAQLSTIIMEYIDAAMVGQLGAEASASISLVSTSTWLLGGICGSLATGFSVLVSHRIGARDTAAARRILRLAIVFALVVSVSLAVVSAAISPYLPHWLGGGEDICGDASTYFLVFALTIPMWELNYLFASMLRASGNVKLPSLVNVLGCGVNVALNYYFIFILDLGVLGAAIATGICISLSAIILGVALWGFSPELRLRGEAWCMASWQTLREALRIGVPIVVEHVAMCSGHIVFTVIVAPLGTAAIAANGFAITIEGLCYMPGYGIGDAATTLVGQSIGAKREELKRSFSYITLALGMGLMTAMGALMYALVPYLMTWMTPDTLVQSLTTTILRIEAFAEPMYAASIVCYSVFVGAGDTVVPCAMNLCSVWLVRIPLAVVLVGLYGLSGAWIAMATELCVRGIIFLVRLRMKD